MKQWMFLYGFLALASFTSCSKDDKPEKPKDGKFWGIFKESPIEEASQFTVVSETGEPIGNASVLIGNSVNVPFMNNTLKTDESGHFSIPEEWQQHQSLTIDAPGYLRVTYLEEAPLARNLVMHKAITPAIHEVRGITTGHQIKDRDGFLDFSLVMGTLTRQELLSLDVNKIVSSQSDRISIVGQPVDLPSNASIPRQKESYVIPVTIEKPIYRLYFSEPGVQKIYATRGRFQFKKIVDGFRSGLPLYELINEFDITGGTIQDIPIVSGQTTANLDVSRLSFSEKRLLTPPAIAADQILIAVSVADINGTLIPTDIKRLFSLKSQALGVLSGQPAFVAQVLKKASEFDPAAPGTDRLSVAIMPFEGKSPRTEYLSLIANPTRISESSYALEVPEPAKTISPMATHLLLSERNNADKSIRRTWEIYAKGWVSTIDLPLWPELEAEVTKKRVEVSFMGSFNGGNPNLGPDVIEAATHVTRSSAEF